MEQDRNKHEIQNKIYQVYDELLDGEGSEGLQALEYLDYVADDLVHDLNQVFSGEGESYDDAIEELSNTVDLSLNRIKKAIDGDSPQDRLQSIIHLLKDLDDRVIEGVGSNFATLDRMSIEEMVDASFAGVDKYVETHDVDSYEEKEGLYDAIGQQLIETWHEDVVGNVVSNAAPNFNDIVREKKQARVEMVKKFARDAGAVALGSLPVIGAMFYLDNKNKR